MERRPCVEHSPPPLQSIQLPIEPVPDRLHIDRQREGGMRRENRKSRLGLLDARSLLQAVDLGDDIGLDPVVRECRWAAVKDAAEAGGSDGSDLVSAGEDGKVERGMGGDIGEGGGRGKAGVAEEASPVAGVLELGEKTALGRVEVKAMEVLQLGGDGEEDFLGADKFFARGGGDDNGLHVGVSVAVHVENFAVEEDVGGAEDGGGGFVEQAVVVLGGREETGCDVTKDVEAKNFEDIEGGLG